MTPIPAPISNASASGERLPNPIDTGRRLSLALRLREHVRVLKGCGLTQTGELFQCIEQEVLPYLEQPPPAPPVRCFAGFDIGVWVHVGGVSWLFTHNQPTGFSDTSLAWLVENRTIPEARARVRPEQRPEFERLCGVKPPVLYIASEIDRLQGEKGTDHAN